MTCLELNQYLKQLRWGETKETIALLRNNSAMEGEMISEEKANNGVNFMLEELGAEPSLPDHSLLRICHHGRFVGTPRHGHASFEIMYVREGSVTHVMEDQELVLHSGSFLVMAPGTYHSTRPCGVGDIAVNFILEPDRLQGSFLSNLSGNPLFTSFFFMQSKYAKEKGYFVIDCGDSAEVNQIATLLLCEYFDPAICADNNVTALFAVLLNSIYRCWAKEHSEQVTTERVQSVIAVRQAIQYISVHYATVTLEELSSRFGYASKYLGRLILKHTGQSFTTLKQQAALQQACVLLSHSDQSIANIAQEVGFSNVTFFYSVFKRYFSISPTEYRKQNRVYMEPMMESL